jgi:hypothetical protein
MRKYSGAITISPLCFSLITFVWCKRRASLTLSSERQRELQRRSLGDGKDKLS